jgi:hypothetical protein
VELQVFGDDLNRLALPHSWLAHLQPSFPLRLPFFLLNEDSMRPYIQLVPLQSLHKQLQRAFQAPVATPAAMRFWATLTHYYFLECVN